MASLFDVTGRVVVVTGGAGLLGAAYARALATAGAHVVVADVDAGGARRVATEAGEAAGGSAIAVATDVTDERSVADLAGAVMDRFGRVDALVNNAALDPKMDPDHAGAHGAAFETLPVSDFRRQLEVDVVGAFLCSRAFAPALVASGRGVIVNISSIYGMAGPDQRIYEDAIKPAGYSVSKAAVAGLTRYLAAYYGRRLRAVTLTLGGVFADHDAGFVARYSDRTPLGRMARPDEYAATLIYLISDAASYSTGSNVVVDGGWTAW